MFRELIRAARLTWHQRKVRRLQARARRLGYSVLPSDLVHEARSELVELDAYCRRSGFLTTVRGARPRARRKLQTGLARIMGLIA